MLSRKEAIAILEEHSRGSAWSDHCLAVAEGSERLARAIATADTVDIGLAWSTGLLHDIGRSVTHDPVLHGVEGYRLLEDRHHIEAAYVCASHILFGLFAEEASQVGLPTRDFTPVTCEQQIVSLVDYLVEGHRPTTLDARFESLRRRNEGNDWFVSRLPRAHSRATRFMQVVDGRLGPRLSTVGVLASIGS